MLLIGKLWTYLADLNEQAQERLGTIIEKEIILREMIYSYLKREWIKFEFDRGIVMKKLIIFILALVGTFALVSCSSNSTPANMQDVLKGNQSFYYAVDDGSDFASVNIADIPSLFNPDDAYMAIQRYAIIDLDADGSEEAVIFVCGATGDTGGYLVLHSSDDHVYGYRTGYRTFENLKTDGTFIYSDGAGSKEGVATIGFTQDGLVITDVLSATGQAYTMDNFMINGQKATQEEYNVEKEKQDLKNNVEWHEYPVS